MNYLLLALCTFMLLPACSSDNSRQPVPVILDTDIGPDYDDVGAMAVLHALADKGDAKPLAVIASNKNELVGPTIDVLNTYFGRPDLTIAAPKGDAADRSAPQKWPEMLTKKYPHNLLSTSDAPDAVEVYREILARQPDTSVTIVTIGFLTNIRNLLDSKPDKFSDLTGVELIQKKVKKLVSMAGMFPAGREYNVFIDSVASAEVFAKWPGQIIFSGFEIGRQILTGPALIKNTKLESPVKDVYALSMPQSPEDHNGRMSWDQTAVLVAIEGPSPYFGLKRGRIVINGGNNEWKDDPMGPHAYLTEQMPFEEVKNIIENLMMHGEKKNS